MDRCRQYCRHLHAGPGLGEGQEFLHFVGALHDALEVHYTLDVDKIAVHQFATLVALPLHTAEA